METRLIRISPITHKYLNQFGPLASYSLYMYQLNLTSKTYLVKIVVCNENVLFGA